MTMRDNLDRCLHPLQVETMLDDFFFIYKTKISNLFIRYHLFKHLWAFLNKTTWLCYVPVWRISTLCHNSINSTPSNKCLVLLKLLNHTYIHSMLSLTSTPTTLIWWCNSLHSNQYLRYLFRLLLLKCLHPNRPNSHLSLI